MREAPLLSLSAALAVVSIVMPNGLPGADAFVLTANPGGLALAHPHFPGRLIQHRQILGRTSGGVRGMLQMGQEASRERNLLRGVLAEALEQQARKRSALEQQREAALLTPVDDGDDKARAKALRCAEALPLRFAEVNLAEDRLIELRSSLAQESGTDLMALRRAMEELGLGVRLDKFDVDALQLAQWGRPGGFDGLVIESPKGAPILVARQSYSDELLRRVSRGTDLWMQVRHGRGSRVLLRTSMCRHLNRSPRECMEAAADLAAYFSDFRRSRDEVEVIFTDSRQVAKRGGRVGQMKENKKIGTIFAQPARAAELARDAQELQGWL
ncbi:hypothetical protein T484DRAFT_1740693 [Baffinella frigidus]|nr:hypothetical protein T484DRAFT_1740693 [Cryptophyta sp. CCMP2293]